MIRQYYKSHFQERPHCLVHGHLALLEAHHVATQDLDELAAQLVHHVQTDVPAQAQLQRGHEVLLEVRVQGADLLWEDLRDEGDGAEIVDAERGEAEELPRHQRHHDVHAVQAHVGSGDAVVLVGI